MVCLASHPSIPSMLTRISARRAQELMRLNVFKGASNLVNAESFIGRCKISINTLAEVHAGQSVCCLRGMRWFPALV